MFVKVREEANFRKLVGITMKNLIALHWDTGISKETKSVG